MATHKDKILEALRLQNGLTSGEIIEYLIQSDPALEKQRIYNALNYLVGVGVLNKEGKRHFLANGYVASNGYKNGSTPMPVIAIYPPTQNRKPAQIAPMIQKRVGKRVSIYTVPTIFDDVISLSLLIKDQWFEVPFFGTIRICQGHEIPDWSVYKRSYYNVALMKIILKNGMSEERQPDSKDIITIDLEE